MSFLNKSCSAGDTIQIIENQAMMQNVQAINRINNNLYLSVSCYEDRLNNEVVTSIFRGFQIIKKQVEYIKQNYP